MGSRRFLIGGLAVVLAATLSVLVAAHPIAPASALAASSIHGGSGLTSTSTSCGASCSTSTGTSSCGASCSTSTGTSSCGASCGASTGTSSCGASCGMSSCGASCGASTGMSSCGASAGFVCASTYDGTPHGPSSVTSSGPSGGLSCGTSSGAVCGTSCPSSAGPACGPIVSVVWCGQSAARACLPVVVVVLRCPSAAGRACRPMGPSCPSSASLPCGIRKCVVSCRQLQVTPSQVPPGGVIRVSGDDDALCDKPGSRVTSVRLLLGNQAVDVAGSRGRFLARVTVPAGATAGDYPVSAACYVRSRGRSHGVAPRPFASRVLTVAPGRSSGTALIALVSGGGGASIVLVILLLVWALGSRMRKPHHDVSWVKEHLRVVAGSSPGSPSAKIRRRPGARPLSLGLEPHDDHLWNGKI